MDFFDKIKMANLLRQLYERREMLMKNYKTTIAGIVGALAIWLPQLQAAMQSGKPIDWGQMILGLAVVVFGALAKDFNVTGGNVAQ